MPKTTTTTTKVTRTPYARKRKRVSYKGSPMDTSSGARMKTNLAKLGVVGETKYVDGILQNSTVYRTDVATPDDWSGTLVNPLHGSGTPSVPYNCMPVPKVGNGYFDRDGRKIYMKKIRISGMIEWEASANSSDHQSLVRLVLFKDSRTNKQAPTPQDVLGSGTGSAGNVLETTYATIFSLTNPKGWGRYQVLKDKYIRHPPVGATQQVPGSVATPTDFRQYKPRVQVPFKMSVKANCYVNFEGTAGTVASVIDNSFHLMAHATDGDSNVRITYYARSSFVG